jgi:hypothetical protein
MNTATPHIPPRLAADHVVHEALATGTPPACADNTRGQLAGSHLVPPRD